MTVTKRDGRKESFNRDKIINAVEKAFISVDGELDDYVTQKASEIADYIKVRVDSDNELNDVESIQDMVEERLMASKRKDVAREYVLYRKERSRFREFNTTLMKNINVKVMGENNECQNANVDELSFGGRKGEADSVLMKEMALNMMSPKIRYNHLHNRSYTHDLASYILGDHNCLSLPFDGLFEKGFNTRHTDVRSANSVNTVGQLGAVLFQLQSLQQFGGVSATHLDWSFVPYVRKSFFKHYVVAYLKTKPEFMNINLEDMMFDTYIDEAGIERDRFDDWLDENKEECLKELGLSKQDFTFENEDKLDPVLCQSALYDTICETKQAIEGMYHNLNTLQSRSGNQLPFTSINYGTCTLPEGRVILKSILSGSLKGVGKYHKTSIFPCGIFTWDKDINGYKGTPNYDLYRLALKSTSRRLYPNYANNNWSTQKSWVEYDRKCKKEILLKLEKEIQDFKNKLINLIKTDEQFYHDRLLLKIDGDDIIVSDDILPIECMATMGALAGHEHLYVKIGDDNPIDISIRDFFYMCKGDTTVVGRPTQIHYNKDSFFLQKEERNVKFVSGVLNEFKSEPGVYKVTYIPEDVSYIGSTSNVKGRIGDHRKKIRQSGCLDSGLKFGDIDLNNYKFEVLEYTNDYKLAEEKYIMTIPNADYKGVSRKYYKNVGLSRNRGYNERPNDIYMNPLIPQDLIDLKDRDIKVLDRDNKWVKVNHVFKNSEFNTPLMMHITYLDDGHKYTLCCTEDHPLWTGSKFVEASKLTTSDKIYRADNKELDIIEIKWHNGRRESYDIGTETGSFIGSDIIMHNCRTVNGADLWAKDSFEKNIRSLLENGTFYDDIVSAAQKDGRGNIAPATVIMPTLAMEADRDVEKFMKLLEEVIEETKDGLIERYNYICSQPVDGARFMYENHTMAGYVPEEGIQSALRHGTLAIGQIGLAETLQLLIGCDHTEARGMELAKRIEQLFKDKCNEYKEKYKLNFGVYMTPAESLCYTSMKKFQEEYGVIENVSDKEFFTNSIHVPVWKEISPMEKIDIESQLTGYSSAGCITYVELEGAVFNNLEALEQIVNYAMEKDIPYFAINIPIDSCDDCGYSGEIGEGNACPECGSMNISFLRRITGYISGDYRKSFNLGKQQETQMRYKHSKKLSTWHR